MDNLAATIPAQKLDSNGTLENGPLLPTAPDAPMPPIAPTHALQEETNPTTLPQSEISDAAEMSVDDPCPPMVMNRQVQEHRQASNEPSAKTATMRDPAPIEAAPQNGAPVSSSPPVGADADATGRLPHEEARPNTHNAAHTGTPSPLDLIAAATGVNGAPEPTDPHPNDAQPPSIVMSEEAIGHQAGSPARGAPGTTGSSVPMSAENDQRGASSAPHGDTMGSADGRSAAVASSHENNNSSPSASANLATCLKGNDVDDATFKEADHAQVRASGGAAGAEVVIAEQTGMTGISEGVTPPSTPPTQVASGFDNTAATSAGTDGSASLATQPDPMVVGSMHPVSPVTTGVLPPLPPLSLRMQALCDMSEAIARPQAADFLATCEQLAQLLRVTHPLDFLEDLRALDAVYHPMVAALQPALPVLLGSVRLGLTDQGHFVQEAGLFENCFLLLRPFCPEPRRVALLSLRRHADAPLQSMEAVMTLLWRRQIIFYTEEERHDASPFLIMDADLYLNLWRQLVDEPFQLSQIIAHLPFLQVSAGAVEGSLVQLYQEVATHLQHPIQDLVEFYNAILQYSFHERLQRPSVTHFTRAPTLFTNVLREQVLPTCAHRVHVLCSPVFESLWQPVVSALGHGPYQRRYDFLTKLTIFVEYLWGELLDVRLPRPEENRQVNDGWAEDEPQSIWRSYSLENLLSDLECLYHVRTRLVERITATQYGSQDSLWSETVHDQVARLARRIFLAFWAAQAEIGYVFLQPSHLTVWTYCLYYLHTLVDQVTAVAPAASETAATPSLVDQVLTQVLTCPEALALPWETTVTMLAVLSPVADWLLPLATSTQALPGWIDHLTAHARSLSWRMLMDRDWTRTTWSLSPSHGTLRSIWQQALVSVQSSTREISRQDLQNFNRTLASFPMPGEAQGVQATEPTTAELELWLCVLEPIWALYGSRPEDVRPSGEDGTPGQRLWPQLLMAPELGSGLFMRVCYLANRSPGEGGLRALQASSTFQRWYAAVGSFLRAVVIGELSLREYADLSFGERELQRVAFAAELANNVQDRDDQLQSVAGTVSQGPQLVRSFQEECERLLHELTDWRRVLSWLASLNRFPATRDEFMALQRQTLRDTVPLADLRNRDQAIKHLMASVSPERQAMLTALVPIQAQENSGVFHALCRLSPPMPPSQAIPDGVAIDRMLHDAWTGIVRLLARQLPFRALLHLVNERTLTDSNASTEIARLISFPPFSANLATPADQVIADIREALQLIEIATSARDILQSITNLRERQLLPSEMSEAEHAIRRSLVQAEATTDHRAQVDRPMQEVIRQLRTMVIELRGVSSQAKLVAFTCPAHYGDVWNLLLSQLSGPEGGNRFDSLRQQITTLVQYDAQQSAVLDALVAVYGAIQPLLRSSTSLEALLDEMALRQVDEHLQGHLINLRNNLSLVESWLSGRALDASENAIYRMQQLEQHCFFVIRLGRQRGAPTAFAVARSVTVGGKTVLTDELTIDDVPNYERHLVFAMKQPTVQKADRDLVEAHLSKLQEALKIFRNISSLETHGHPEYQWLTTAADDERFPVSTSLHDLRRKATKTERDLTQWKDALLACCRRDQPSPLVLLEPTEIGLMANLLRPRGPPRQAGTVKTTLSDAAKDQATRLCSARASSHHAGQSRQVSASAAQSRQTIARWLYMYARLAWPEATDSRFMHEAAQIWESSLQWYTSAQEALDAVQSFLGTVVNEQTIAARRRLTSSGATRPQRVAIVPAVDAVQATAIVMLDWMAKPSAKPSKVFWCDEAVTIDDIHQLGVRVTTLLGFRFAVGPVGQLMPSVQKELLELSRSLESNRAGHAELLYVAESGNVLFDNTSTVLPHVAVDRDAANELLSMPVEKERLRLAHWWTTRLRPIVVHGEQGAGKTHFIENRLVGQHDRVVRIGLGQSINRLHLIQLLSPLGDEPTQSESPSSTVILLNASFQTSMEAVHRLAFALFVQGALRDRQSGQVLVLPSVPAQSSLASGNIPFRVVLEIAPPMHNLPNTVGDSGVSRLLSMLALSVEEVNRTSHPLAIGVVEQTMAGLLRACYEPHSRGTLTNRRYDGKAPLQLPAGPEVAESRALIERYSLMHRTWPAASAATASQNGLLAGSAHGDSRLRLVAYLELLKHRLRFFSGSDLYRLHDPQRNVGRQHLPLYMALTLVRQASMLAAEGFPVSVDGGLSSLVLLTEQGEQRNVDVRLLIIHSPMNDEDRRLALALGPSLTFDPAQRGGQTEHWLPALANGLGFGANVDVVQRVFRQRRFVLIPDYVVRFLLVNERKRTRLPLVIESETGVGKTYMLETFVDLINAQVLQDGKNPMAPHVARRLFEFIKSEYLPKFNVFIDDVPKRLHYSTWLSGCLNVCSDPRSEASHQIKDEDWQKLRSLLNELRGRMRTDQVNRLVKSFAVLPKTFFTEMKLMERDAGMEAKAAQLASAAERDADVDANAVITDVCDLLQAMAQLPVRRFFFRMLIHPGVTEADVFDLMSKAIVNARDMPACEVVCFFDELNTSSVLGIFHQMLVDRTLAGDRLPDNIFFVAAINPYSSPQTGLSATREYRRRLAQQAEGSEAENVDRLNGQPTAYRAEYNVHPLPASLQQLRWQFPSLKGDSLNGYIRGQFELARVSDTVAEPRDADATSQQLAAALVHCHELLASQLGPGSVSQRDIQRVFRILPFARRRLNLNEQQASWLAIALVYYFRLPLLLRQPTDYERELVRQKKALPRPFTREDLSFRLTELVQSDLTATINRIVEAIANPSNFRMGEGVAMNQALRENIVAMVVAAHTNVPLAIIGPPGSSKTLSFQILLQHLRGPLSPTVFCQRLDPIDPYFCQCSKDTTSEDISTIIDMAKARQRIYAQTNERHRCVVFMDEASLPSESRMVLKVLHSYLDECAVGFISISNAPFDPANANRMMQMMRSPTSDDDMRLLALRCLGFRDVNRSDFNAFADGLCRAFRAVLHHQEFSRWFHYRDFIYTLRQLRREHPSELEVMDPVAVLCALERNFNGLEALQFRKLVSLFFTHISEAIRQPFVVPSESLFRSVRAVLSEALQAGGSVALSGTAQSMRHPGTWLRDRPRFKLVIDPTDDDSGARLLFDLGLLEYQTTHVVHVSEFASDHNDRYYVEQLSLIQHSMERGERLLLIRGGPLYGSLYDVFNQNFTSVVDANETVFSKIAIGSRTKNCAVHPNFECIVHLRQSELSKTPAPFLSRFEKYRLNLAEFYQEHLAALESIEERLIRQARVQLCQLVNAVGSECFYGWSGEETTLLSLLMSHCGRPSLGSQGHPATRAGRIHRCTELTANPNLQPLLNHIGTRDDTRWANLRVVVRSFAVRLLQLMPPEAAVERLQSVVEDSELYTRLYFTSDGHFSLKYLVMQLVGLHQQRKPATAPGYTQDLPPLPVGKTVIYTRANASSLHLEQTVRSWPDKLQSAVHVVSVDDRVMTQRALSEILCRLAANPPRPDLSVVLVAMTAGGRGAVGRVSFVRQLVDDALATAKGADSARPLSFAIVVTFPPESLYAKHAYPTIYLRGWDFYFCDSCSSIGDLHLRHFASRILQSASSSAQLSSAPIPSSLEERELESLPKWILKDALLDYCRRVVLVNTPTPGGAVFDQTMVGPERGQVHPDVAPFYLPTTTLSARARVLESILLGVPEIHNRIITLLARNLDQERFIELLRDRCRAIFLGQSHISLGDELYYRLTSQIREAIAGVLHELCVDYGLSAIAARLVANEATIVARSLALVAASDDADRAPLRAGSDATYVIELFRGEASRLPLQRLIRGQMKRLAKQAQTVASRQGGNFQAAMERLIAEHDALAQLFDAVAPNGAYMMDYAVELIAPELKSYFQASTVSFEPDAWQFAKHMAAQWLIADDGARGARRSLTSIQRLAYMHATMENGIPPQLLPLLSPSRLLGESRADRGRALRAGFMGREALVLSGEVQRDGIVRPLLESSLHALYDSLVAVVSNQCRPFDVASWLEEFNHLGLRYPLERLTAPDINGGRLVDVMDLCSQLFLLDPARVRRHSLHEVMGPLLSPAGPRADALYQDGALALGALKMSVARLIVTAQHADVEDATPNRDLSPAQVAAASRDHVYLQLLEWYLVRSDSRVVTAPYNRAVALSTLGECVTASTDWRSSLLSRLIQHHKSGRLNVARASGVQSGIEKLLAPADHLILDEISKVADPLGGALANANMHIYCPLQYKGARAVRQQLPAAMQHPLYDLFFAYALRKLRPHSARARDDAIIGARKLTDVMQAYQSLQITVRSTWSKRVMKAVWQVLLLEGLSQILAGMARDASRRWNKPAVQEVLVPLMVYCRKELLDDETLRHHWLASLCFTAGFDSAVTILSNSIVQRWFGGGQWSQRLSRYLAGSENDDFNRTAGRMGQLSFTLGPAPVPREGNDTVLFAHLYGPYENVKEALADAVRSGDATILRAALQESLNAPVQLAPCTMHMILILAFYYNFFDQSDKRVDVAQRVIEEAIALPALVMTGPPLIVLRALLYPQQCIATIPFNSVSRYFNPERGQPLDAVDLDRRHFLVNLMATVVGTGNPYHHIWTLLFSPLQVQHTYGFSSTRNDVVSANVHYDCGCTIDEKGDIFNGNGDVLRAPAAYLAYMMCYGAMALSMILPSSSDLPLSPPSPTTAPLVGPILTVYLVNSTGDRRDRQEGLRSKAIHFCYERVMRGWQCFEGNRPHLVPLLLARSLERQAWLAGAGPEREPSWSDVYRTQTAKRQAEEAFNSQVYQHTWQRVNLYEEEYQRAGAQQRARVDEDGLRQSVQNFPPCEDATWDELKQALSAYRAEPAPVDAATQQGSMRWRPNLAILEAFLEQRGRLRLLKQVPSILALYQYLHHHLNGQVTLNEAASLPLSHFFPQRKEARDRLTGYVEAFNMVHAAMDGVLEVGACRQQQDFHPISLDKTPLSYLLSTTDDSINDILFHVVRALVNTANEFLGLCQRVCETDPGPAPTPTASLDRVTRLLLLPFTKQFSAVNIQEALLPEAHDLLLCADAPPYDKKLELLLTTSRSDGPGTGVPTFDLLRMQRGILLEYVAGRRHLLLDGLRRTFVFKAPPAAAVAGTGVPTARGEPADRNLGLPTELPAELAECEKVLIKLGRLGLEQLQEASRSLEAAMARLAAMKPLSPSTLSARLVDFLVDICECQSARLWCPADVPVGLVCVVASRVDEHITKRSSELNRVPKALQRAIPPNLMQVVRHKLAALADNPEAGLATVSGACEVLMEQVESAERNVFHPGVEHSMTAFLSIMGESEADVPLLYDMPTELLDQHLGSLLYELEQCRLELRLMVDELRRSRPAISTLDEAAVMDRPLWSEVPLENDGNMVI